MAELKTKPTGRSVSVFLKSVEPESRREDCLRLLKMMGEVTGARPRMWGAGIVGFGEYHYKYASGREGDWMRTGFSPRKQNLVVYIMPGFSNFKPTMDKLGKYKTGKSCLYRNKLEDVDFRQLRSLVRQGYKRMGELYDCK